MHMQHLDSTIELLNIQQKRGYSKNWFRSYFSSREIDEQQAGHFVRVPERAPVLTGKRRNSSTPGCLGFIPLVSKSEPEKAELTLGLFLILDDRGYFSELTSTGTPFSVSQGDFGLAFTISKMACIGRHSRVPLSDTTNGRSSAAG